MFKTLLTRIDQGHRTVDYPDGINLPERFRGLPVIDTDRCKEGRCKEGCSICSDICPTQAITRNGPIKIDLGRCLFCTECLDSCPEGAISFKKEHRLAVRKREDLILSDSELELAAKLERKMLRIFGRSLKLRQVSAGGCNGCEVDVNVLNTLVFDLGRFGVQFVASPRHADGILVTGVIPENMRLATLKTYEAVPAPKLVIAVGACAIAGGPFARHPEIHNGVDSILPVDLYIPGCPPHPWTILDGLLRLLGRAEERMAG